MTELVAWDGLAWARLAGSGAAEPQPEPPPGPPDPERPTNYGFYEPDDSNTGFITTRPMSSYTPPGDACWRIGDADALVEDREVWGRVKPEAPNITFRNLYVHGLPQNKLVNGAHQPLADNVSTLTNGGVTRYVDCTFSAQAVWGGVDGHKGGNAIYERCVFEGTIDGAQVYDRDAWFYGCIFRRLIWIPDDPAQGPEGSHNDRIQFQGGNKGFAPKLTVIGCVLDMGTGTYGSSNLGFLLTNDRGPTGQLTFERNFIRTKTPDGTRTGHPMNFSIDVTNVTVDHNRLQLGKSGWHIIAKAGTRSKIGANNTDYDTGAAAIVANG